MKITVSYDDLTCDITRKNNSERCTAHALTDIATLASWNFPKPPLKAHDASGCARSTPHPRRYSW